MPGVDHCDSFQQKKICHMIPNPRRLRLSPNSPVEISEDSMVQCSKNPFGISSCCYFIPWISWRAMSIKYLFLIRTETIEITKRIGAKRRPLKNKCLKLVQSRHIVILKKNLISEKKAPNSCYTLVISLVLTLFFWATNVFFLLSSQRSQNFCLAPPVTRRQHPSSPRDSVSPRMPSKSAEGFDKNQRIHKGITRISCLASFPTSTCIMMSAKLVQDDTQSGSPNSFDGPITADCGPGDLIPLLQEVVDFILWPRSGRLWQKHLWSKNDVPSNSQKN